MPYVRRDPTGRVSALLAAPESDKDEFLEIAHPDVIAFLREGDEPSGPWARLSTLDLDMARITEDLIDILVARNVLMFTDLPAAAQRKLLERRRLRQEMAPVVSVINENEGPI